MPSRLIARCPPRGGWGIWKRNGLRGGDRLFDQFHALDLLELAHRLRRLRGHGAKPVVELAQVGDFLLLVLVGGGLLLVVHLPLLEEGGVIAGVGGQLLLCDLVDAFHDLIHELAVMGDHQERAGVRLEIILQPEQRHQVEVVGRLVEQEEVGLHDEQACEMRAHDPATAHLTGRASEIGFPVAETAEHLLGFGFGLRIAQGLMLGVGLEVFRAADGAGLFELAQGFFRARAIRRRGPSPRP